MGVSSWLRVVVVRERGGRRGVSEVEGSREQTEAVRRSRKKEEGREEERRKEGKEGSFSLLNQL